MTFVATVVVVEIVSAVPPPAAAAAARPVGIVDLGGIAAVAAGTARGAGRARRTSCRVGVFSAPPRRPRRVRRTGAAAAPAGAVETTGLLTRPGAPGDTAAAARPAGGRTYNIGPVRGSASRAAPGSVVPNVLMF